MKREKANLEGWYLEDYHVESGWGMYYTSDIYLHGVGISNPSLQRQYLPLKQQEQDILNCP